MRRLHKKAGMIDFNPQTLALIAIAILLLLVMLFITTGLGKSILSVMGLD